MRLAPAALVALALASPAQRALAAEPPAGLVPSADGQELLDAAGGHAWARCVEGMRWDGRSCTGEPAFFTLAEALAMARARSETSGRGWRVPRVPELRQFVDRLGRAAQPAVLAPAAPPGWYWTSTVRIDSDAVNPYAYRNVQRGVTESHTDRLVPQVGWAVDLRTGEAKGDMSRRERLPLRLVRSLK